jgi:N6-adenosine-specific RNA methylase IME4
MMWGDKNKNAAAGKHYDLMAQDDLCNLDVRSIVTDKAACFMWATCPRLPLAIECMQEWGFHYRGVAYIWVKTNKQGEIIKGQGIPPTFTKPLAELVLVGTTNKVGRPFPIHSMNQAQTILHPRAKHSAKPPVIKEMIVELCGDLPRVELFSTEKKKLVDGWVHVGRNVDGQDIQDVIPQLQKGTYLP